MLGRDHAVVITTAGATRAFGEAFFRLELGERLLVIDDAAGSAARGGRVVEFDGHGYLTSERPFEPAAKRKR